MQDQMGRAISRRKNNKEKGENISKSEKGIFFKLLWWFSSERDIKIKYSMNKDDSNNISSSKRASKNSDVSNPFVSFDNISREINGSGKLT